MQNANRLSVKPFISTDLLLLLRHQLDLTNGNCLKANLLPTTDYKLKLLNAANSDAGKLRNTKCPNSVPVNSP